MKCPCPGCDAEIQITAWGCPKHWLALPKPLRRAISGAHAKPLGVNSPEYEHATAAAIEFLMNGEKEAPTWVGEQAATYLKYRKQMKEMMHESAVTLQQKVDELFDAYIAENSKIAQQYIEGFNIKPETDTKSTE